MLAVRSTAKQGYQQGHSHKITDWEKFRAFAATPGDQTQAEMAQLWPEAIREDIAVPALIKHSFNAQCQST